jgi:hypothetical protein
MWCACSGRSRPRTTAAPGGRWPRARGLTAAAVDDALADGSIVRTHVLRPTWHLVAAEDVRWLLALTAPRVKALTAYGNRQSGLDADTIVGYDASSTYPVIAAYHFDGTAWSAGRISLTAGTVQSSLNSVALFGAEGLWAVGFALTRTMANLGNALLARWNSGA